MEVLKENQKAIESGELWKEKGFEPIEVVLPTRTFEDRMDMQVGDIQVIFKAIPTHSPDTIVAWLPKQDTVLAGDALEDPLPLVIPQLLNAQTQLYGLGELLSLPVHRIYPSHGEIETISNGGYTRELVVGNIAYMSRLLAKQPDPDFLGLSAESFIAEELKRGELHWWEPYREAHRYNAQRARDFYGESQA
jgi:glyoxylase-like metal-dependent hydrolase (beta-lactamase superfamily II)